MHKFPNHAKSHHKYANNLKCFIEEKLKPIDKAIDKGREMQVKNNAEEIISIIDIIILCRGQNIALEAMEITMSTTLVQVY